jgi:PAS domain S-box-containing protein
MAFFVVDKDNGLIPQVLSAILDECVNGITLSDPDLEDSPIIYANKSFERLTGYSQEEIIGRNCRFLQGEDTAQEARHQIAEAISKQEAVEVNLRNYKKDGTLFYNHLKIVPLFDKKNRVLYYLGVQYDITKDITSKNEIKTLTELLNAKTQQIK